MNSPVDRVENASRDYRAPAKVKRTAESAPEKDRKFTDILGDEMDHGHHDRPKEEKPQGVTPGEDQVELSEATQAKLDSKKTSKENEPDKSSSPDEMDHVDLKA